MHRVRGIAALGCALWLYSAAPALAHDGAGERLREPTARERSLFEARRSQAARGVGAAGAPEAEIGSFGPPFSEPTLGDGRSTDQDCVTNEDGTKSCKPAAGTLNVLPDGRILYWDALEGTENIKTSTVTEYGVKAINDQSRVLDLIGPTWSR